MEFKGKTLEEAIGAGLEALKLLEENAEIKIIEEPTKGLFGRLKGEAVVDITPKANGKEKAVEVIQNVIKLLGYNAKAEFVGTDEKPEINIIAEKSAEIIGFRGEVLDALQTIAGAVANIGKDNYQKIVVNCENYRERREETLIKLAERLAEKATDMRREVMLEPMNPFERRIIHTALAESTTVKTRSDGKEPNRYVVIVPNDKDEYSKPYNAGRNPDRDNRRGGFKKGNKGGFKGNGKFERNKKASGFGEQKKKSGFNFGTYLGNFKDEQ